MGVKVWLAADRDPVAFAGGTEFTREDGGLYVYGQRSDGPGGLVVLAVVAHGHWTRAELYEAQAAGPSSASPGQSMTPPSSPLHLVDGQPASGAGDAGGIADQTPDDWVPAGPTSLPAPDAAVGPGVVTPPAQDSAMPSASPSTGAFGGADPVVVEPGQ